MQTLVLIIQYLSIFGLLFESAYIIRNWKSKLHGYLLLNCTATFVNNAGMLAVMLSENYYECITAQVLSYIGAVWIPFSLLLFLTVLCNVRTNQKVMLTLGAVHAATYVIVLTNSWHNLYYRNIRSQCLLL